MNTHEEEDARIAAVLKEALAMGSKRVVVEMMAPRVSVFYVEEAPHDATLNSRVYERQRVFVDGHLGAVLAWVRVQ